LFACNSFNNCVYQVGRIANGVVETLTPMWEH
jgi:hypothetical protein